MAILGLGDTTELPRNTILANAQMGSSISKEAQPARMEYKATRSFQEDWYQYAISHI